MRLSPHYNRTLSLTQLETALGRAACDTRFMYPVKEQSRKLQTLHAVVKNRKRTPERVRVSRDYLLALPVVMLPLPVFMLCLRP